MCAKAKVASLIIYTNARITACQLVARPAAWRDVFLSHITAHASLCVYVCVCAVYALLPLLHVCVSTLSVIVVCGPLCQCPLHSLPAKRHTLPHFASLFHFLPLPLSISLSTHTLPNSCSEHLPVLPLPFRSSAWYGWRCSFAFDFITVCFRYPVPCIRCTKALLPISFWPRLVLFIAL